MEHSDTSDQRPPIYDPMKREVRQHCGFGCAMCGLPLYTYEHMLGWANVHRHVAEELTLLCYQHQYEKTHGLLSIEDVKRADLNPYNLREGISKPYTLHYSGSNCIADIGRNVFSFQDDGSNPEFVAFAIDEEPIIGFRLDNGHWLLNPVCMIGMMISYCSLLITNSSIQYLPGISNWLVVILLFVKLNEEYL